MGMKFLACYALTPSLPRSLPLARRWPEFVRHLKRQSEIFCLHAAEAEFSMPQEHKWMEA